MSSGLRQILLRWLVMAFGVMLAAKLIPGIRCDDGWTLFCFVVLLSIFNSFLKPLLVLFTLPFILVTMGIGIIVINALLFLLVGRWISGFTVTSFGSALGGSLVVSATNFIVTPAIDPEAAPAIGASSPGGGDVIDV